MAAAIAELADAVTATLNGATLSQAFTATREYIPTFDVPTLGTLRVTVVPASLTMAQLARQSDDYEYVIHVAVQKRLAQASTSPAQITAAADPLMQLTEEIADLFRGTAPGDLPARFAGLENVPIFDPTHLFEKQTFTSLLLLRFKQVRSR